jgi:uncharacterized membrane-anchored protein YjiN (DUF445 family)
MVGALADWFAVVALFRHPLGLPIPHTAIIRTNKDRIGKTLATFVVTNFLTGEAIRSRLDQADLTARAAEWLWANAGIVSARIVAAVPLFIRSVRDEDIQRLLHGTILAKLRSIEVAPLAGKALEVLTAGETLDELLAASMGVAEDLVRANQELIQAQVRSRIPLPDLPGVAFVTGILADAIALRVSEGILETLREMRAQPSHPLRRQFRAKMVELADALQHSDAYCRQGEAVKEELLRHPAVGGYLAELARGLVREFEEDIVSAESRFRARVEEGAVGLAHVLIQDHALRAKLNGWLRTALIQVVEEHGPEVAEFIRERVSNWDSAQLTVKLEESVGRDLQYIRLNGTLVGGAVGLLIYMVSRWVW